MSRWNITWFCHFLCFQLVVTEPLNSLLNRHFEFFCIPTSLTQKAVACYLKWLGTIKIEHGQQDQTTETLVVASLEQACRLTVKSVYLLTLNCPFQFFFKCVHLSAFLKIYIFRRHVRDMFECKIISDVGWLWQWQEHLQWIKEKPLREYTNVC